MHHFAISKSVSVLDDGKEFFCVFLISSTCVFMCVFDICVFICLSICEFAICKTFDVKGLLVRCRGGYVCVYGAALKFIRKLRINQNFLNCENLPKRKREAAICTHHINSLKIVQHFFHYINAFIG